MPEESAWFGSSFTSSSFLHLLKQVYFSSWFTCGNTQFDLLLPEIPFYLSHYIEQNAVETMQTFELQSVSLNLFQKVTTFSMAVTIDKLPLYLVVRETSASDSSKAIHCRKGNQEGLLPFATVVVPAEVRS